MKRTKTLLVAGLILLLLILAIIFFLKKEKTSPPIDDAFWLNLNRRSSDIFREQLKAAPQVLVVRESHYQFNPTNGIGIHYGWLDGRMANLHISFSELVGDAYGVDYTHTEFPEKWTHGQWTNCYDVIVTITNQPQAALESAARKFLQQQYGLSWHRENKDTQVLLIRAKDMQLLDSKATTDFTHSVAISELAGDLENFFGQPVIDETGAAKRYDKTLELVPSRWVNGRTTDLTTNNIFLAKYGLELVSTNRPQEWLVMEKVK